MSKHKLLNFFKLRIAGVRLQSYYLLFQHICMTYITQKVAVNQRAKKTTAITQP